MFIILLCPLELDLKLLGLGLIVPFDIKLDAMTDPP